MVWKEEKNWTKEDIHWDPLGREGAKTNSRGLKAASHRLENEGISNAGRRRETSNLQPCHPMMTARTQMSDAPTGQLQAGCWREIPLKSQIFKSTTKNHVTKVLSVK